MEEMGLLELIKQHIDIECIKKKTTISEISKKMGKNERYISNKFNQNNTISIDFLYQVAKELECDVSILLPSSDQVNSLKSFK
jgi:transcriptional regulator with XRE-family HTH domain